MSPYSQPSPNMVNYSQQSPKMSPYSQHSPKMSPYSQQSPKMSPYSQVSPAYHQTQLVAPQTSPSYPPKTMSPVVPQTSQQKPDPAYSVPSFELNKEAGSHLMKDQPSTKPSEFGLLPKASSRSNTDSPRLETPPGLALPTTSEDPPQLRHSLTLAGSTKIDSTVVTKSLQINRVTATTSTVSSSNLTNYTSNPISGMASMTNKIKLLESKMQTAKSKSAVEKNIEDNSLKNWWKPQIELKKFKPPCIANDNGETEKLEDSPVIEPDMYSNLRESTFDLDVGTTKLEGAASNIRSTDNNVNGKNKLDTELDASIPSCLDAKQETAKTDSLLLSTENTITNQLLVAADDLSAPVHSKPSSKQSLDYSICEKPDQVLSTKPRALQPTELTQLLIASKKQIPPVCLNQKGIQDSSSVPYDSKQQRTLDSYPTPNLERMEIKNSGIPGPSAVTWKRKSTEDSPNVFQAKKRKIDKSLATGNDIYQFEDEKEDGSCSVTTTIKEDKVCKGPVYKYKSALISRDIDTDAKVDKVIDDVTQVDNFDNSLHISHEQQSASKKRTKRPKHEEWSVVKKQSLKGVKLGPHDDCEEIEEDKQLVLPKNNSIWGLTNIPKSSQKVTENDTCEVVSTVIEQPKTEGKVAVDKWYQAFGAASDMKSKKKNERVLLKKDIKQELEEKSTRSILDIPPEARRKTRPNFGGIQLFSPDWSRLVKRHHDRCRVPPSLDSSRTLNPKILVGQTTPKKSYEDFARKDMVSPPDLLTMERERMEAKALTEFSTTRSPEEDLGGELPSIVETILANRKKLRQGAKMGRMYRIPFQKEKKRIVVKGVVESAMPEDNMGLLPTPGLPQLTTETREVLLGNQSTVSFGNFRQYTLNKYLDFGEHGKPRPTSWSPEVLDSKTRSKSSASQSMPSLKEIFGVDSPLKRIKSKKDKKDPDRDKDREAALDQKVKKVKTKKEPVDTHKTEPTIKPNVKDKFVPVEKEEDDTFAFSQEIGEPTEDENLLQSELGGFALDLLDDNPSWMKQVTIQNLVVWEPIQPVSAKKKKPKKKRGKRSGWDFAVGKRKSKSSRDVSRASSPVMEEIHDIEYTLNNVILESNRWVVDKNAGETILQRASKMGYPDVVAYAVGMQDMSVREKDYAGFTPLDKAAFRGHHEVAKVLLMYGADPSSGVKGTRALHDAVEGGSRETVQTLLCYGADPMLHNYSGCMPLDLAKGEKNMKAYLYNILADLHGKPPNVRGHPAPVVERWNVSHSPEFHDPRLDPKLSESCQTTENTTVCGLDDFIFEVSSQPLPTEFQFFDRQGDFVLYRELKEFAKKFGHHKGDIKNKCYIIEMKKSDFLKTSHCKQMDRRHVEVKYHEREEEDTLILVKVDKFVRKILNAERISVPR